MFGLGLSDPDAGEEDFTLAGEGEHKGEGSSGEEGFWSGWSSRGEEEDGRHTQHTAEETPGESVCLCCYIDFSELSSALENSCFQYGHMSDSQVTCHKCVYWLITDFSFFGILPLICCKLKTMHLISISRNLTFPAVLYAI